MGFAHAVVDERNGDLKIMRIPEQVLWQPRRANNLELPQVITYYVRCYDYSDGDQWFSRYSVVDKQGERVPSGIESEILAKFGLKVEPR